MGKSQRGTGFQISGNLVFINLGLFFVGNQNHGNIGRGHRFGHRQDLKAFLFGLGLGFAALVKSDNNFNSTVAEI